MAFPPQHELHRRRFGRNVGVALALAGLVVLVFALAVVKVTRGEPLIGYDPAALSGGAAAPAGTGGAP